MNTNAKDNQNLVEAMLFIVAPMDEDPSSFKDVISVCECALEKAQDSWSESEYVVFSELLIANANKGIGALFTERNSELNTALKKMIPYIEECEEKYDTRVEF